MEKKSLIDLNQWEVGVLLSALSEKKELYEKFLLDAIKHDMPDWVEKWTAKVDTCSDLIRRLME